MTGREQRDVVIIGAGHAGLATSYHLAQRGHDHVVLERDAIASSWLRDRWDSFSLVTPNWTLQLPGHVYDGDRPDAFMQRDDVVDHLRDYVRRYALPVEEGTDVTRVAPREGGGFEVTTTRGSLGARAVVVASGFFRHARIPSEAASLPPGLAQLHTSRYRRPDALPPGPVLVVGSGQSGCQIAEELLAAGRSVFLSTGSSGRGPRRYRGSDLTTWLQALGMWEWRVESLESPDLKFASSAHATGVRGGHTINLHRFARDGMTLLGRFAGVAEGRLRFADDLQAHLEMADGMADGIRRVIDDHIARVGLEAPLPDPSDDHPGTEGRLQVPITQLDPSALAAVVWATGFAIDYRWIDVPDLLDASGYPRHMGGAAQQEGLYFTGLHYQTRLSSDLFVGVGRDAAQVAERIGMQLRA